MGLTSARRNLEQSLAPSDVEWTVVKPYLDKIGVPTTIQNELRAGTIPTDVEFPIAKNYSLFVNRHPIPLLPHHARLYRKPTNRGYDRLMYGFVGWWGVLLAYFSDEAWTAKQFTAFDQCVVIVHEDWATATSVNT